MPATIIDGREAPPRVRAEVAHEVAGLKKRTGRPPGPATTLVGDDPASALCVASERRAQGSPGLRPCTPLGVIELLGSFGAPLEGVEGR